jgi:hypothetical protein
MDALAAVRECDSEEPATCCPAPTEEVPEKYTKRFSWEKEPETFPKEEKLGYPRGESDNGKNVVFTGIAGELLNQVDTKFGSINIPEPDAKLFAALEEKGAEHLNKFRQSPSPIPQEVRIPREVRLEPAYGSDGMPMEILGVNQPLAAGWSAPKPTEDSRHIARDAESEVIHGMGNLAEIIAGIFTEAKAGMVSAALILPEAATSDVPVNKKTPPEKRPEFTTDLPAYLFEMRTRSFDLIAEAASIVNAVAKKTEVTRDDVNAIITDMEKMTESADRSIQTFINGRDTEWTDGQAGLCGFSSATCLALISYVTTKIGGIILKETSEKKTPNFTAALKNLAMEIRGSDVYLRTMITSKVPDINTDEPAKPALMGFDLTPEMLEHMPKPPVAEG